jgi:hypothetical protein
MITQDEVDLLKTAKALQEWVDEYNLRAEESDAVAVLTSITEYTSAIEIDGILVYESEDMNPPEDVPLLDFCKANYKRALRRCARIDQWTM